MGHPLCGPFEQLIIQKTRARQPTLNMHQSTSSSSKSSIPAIRQKTVGIGKATLVAWLFSYIRCFLLKHIQIFIHCCLGPDPSWKVCLIRQIKFIKPKTAAICPYKVLYQRCLAYMAKYKIYVPAQTKFHRKEGSPAGVRRCALVESVCYWKCLSWRGWEVQARCCVSWDVSSSLTPLQENQVPPRGRSCPSSQWHHSTEQETGFFTVCFQL